MVQHLGEAARKLREKLGEDIASIKKYDVPLERATTPIPAALKAYTDARKAIQEKGDLEAVPFYKQAIELDSRYAMAHSGLAVSYYNLNQMGQASEEVRLAYEAGDRQTYREHLNIATLYTIWRRATSKRPSGATRNISVPIRATTWPWAISPANIS